jgi:uridine kinase
MRKPFILGVTGGSGSGKTRFIRQLVDRFSEDQLCLISQDNYYRPRHLQAVDSKGFQNFDEPQSIDLVKMKIPSSIITGAGLIVIFFPGNAGLL